MKAFKNHCFYFNENDKLIYYAEDCDADRKHTKIIKAIPDTHERPEEFKEEFYKTVKKATVDGLKELKEFFVSEEEFNKFMRATLPINEI